MDNDERQQVIKTVNEIMSGRMRSQAQLDAAVREFSGHLFAALERVLTAMARAGIPGLGKFRRLAHPAGDGREAFQFYIEDWSIIFVPLRGFARPNILDEARIPSVQFKEPCGRIAVFLNDNPQGSAFYDFLIFQDRSWFAWGYGWPRQHSNMDETDFEALALELVYSFVKDIFTTWHTRAETTLATALDAKKREYVFGVPGEDRQINL